MWGDGVGVGEWWEKKVGEGKRLSRLAPIRLPAVRTEAACDHAQDTPPSPAELRQVFFQGPSKIIQGWAIGDAVLHGWHQPRSWRRAQALLIVVGNGSYAVGSLETRHPPSRSHGPDPLLQEVCEV